MIIYDGNITIAEGASRKETAWKNKDITWRELLGRCWQPVRTHELHNDYLNFKKDRQDEIKDVGGFVGGPLAGGARNKSSVIYRTVLTLDLDFATADFWAQFKFQFSCAAMLYSTHKHSLQNPRYRLVIPLNRHVFNEEYQAIARKLAGMIDIEIFDPTTFQPERLMYWPSVSIDGEYVFEWQDGPFLCADKMLAHYHNWQDSSQWPISATANKIVLNAISKQIDPLTKGGLIGAFCRAYSIQEAIDTYLQDAYQGDGVRYSYLGGSTSNGAVVYEDKFIFSHHGSDPISGKLCNAFDLVRIHKYGHFDEGKSDDTPVNSLPSYQHMCDMIGTDAKVLKLIGTERINAVKDFFAPLTPENGTEQNLDWLTFLDADRKGNYRNSIFNVYTILANDPDLKNAFAFDSFRQRKVFLTNLPWRAVTKTDRYLRNADEAQLRRYIEAKYHIVGKGIIDDALVAYMEYRSFHPVREYLNTLNWDGIPRLDTLLVDYMGAVDSNYMRAITRKTFTAAVARIYEPGCKFDYALTMCGPEGIKKSSLIKRMAGEWFSDSLTTVVGKEAYEQIQGFWIIEGAEMAALRRAEVEHTKTFVSKQEDSFRPAYGHTMEYYPRQCIFIFTTNENEPLRGVNGNRRFWVADVWVNLLCSKSVDDITDYIRDQLWAEAKFRYSQREPLYLPPELDNEAKIQQQLHGEQDDRTGIISDYLETYLPRDWDTKNILDRRLWLTNPRQRDTGTERRQKVCVIEIMCEALGKEPKDITQHSTKEIHNLMKSIPGWEQSRAGKSRFSQYGLQKAYIRKAER